MLYRPAMGPTPALLLAPVAPAGVLLLAGWLAWRDRIAWRAPREQQQEAAAES